ncbi:hypothetical protein ACFZB2_36060 [Streptomyces bobili]|uniref:AraC-like ligand-binding domain-containing protein n=1 Tax=Streptomyces bobili TaxID=67280 RepID=UPI0036E6B4FF
MGSLRLLTTDSVPIRQRRTYWREALSQTFAAADVAVPDEVCSGTIRTSPLGRLQLTASDGGPMPAWRTPGLIAQNESEYVVVNLLGRGVARVEQEAREVYLRPGEFTFCDMARPIHMEFPDPYQVKSLVLPRQALGLSDSELRQISASPLRSDMALGGLLSLLLSRLADTAGTFRPRTGELLASNVVDLLTVLADEQLGRVSEGTPSGDAVLLLRIRTFIGRHLADPDPTPRGRCVITFRPELLAGPSLEGHRRPPSGRPHQHRRRPTPHRSRLAKAPDRPRHHRMNPDRPRSCKGP